MNAFTRIDPDTFLRYAAEHPDLRLELERGLIVQQMTGGSLGHHSIAEEINLALRSQIDRAVWRATQGRGVRTALSVRYPDVVVEPLGEARDSLSTDRPAIIVEVLSPSTASTDLHQKPLEYLAIPTLQAYIVASQDEPAMVIWERQSDGSFPATPRELEGATEKLNFTGCNQPLTLDFAQIYADL